MGLKIQVIIGSTRQGRFGEKPAKWIYEELKKKEGVEAELIDLRDYPLPFFNEPVSPSAKEGDYQNEEVIRWTKKVEEADGYIIVTPEYNHSFSAVLKNSLDYVYKEWNNKAVGFISYGSVAGARAIEQLRLVAIELQMAPIRTSIHIPAQVYLTAKNQEESNITDPFEPIHETAEKFLNQLIWWTNALKEARQKL